MSMLRSSVAVLLGIAFAIATASSSYAQLSEEEIDAMAAEALEEVQREGFEFAFPDLDGAEVSSDDDRFKGKVVLVDIWGTWCAPCRREAPFLAKLYKENKDRGLEIVGIAFEMSSGENAKKKVKRFVEEHGAEYTALFGGKLADARERFPRGIARLGYPTVVIIDRTGAVRDIEAGFWPTTAQDIESKVEELLEEPAANTPPSSPDG